MYNVTLYNEVNHLETRTNLVLVIGVNQDSAHVCNNVFTKISRHVMGGVNFSIELFEIDLSYQCFAR